MAMRGKRLLCIRLAGHIVVQKVWFTYITDLFIVGLDLLIRLGATTRGRPTP